MHKNISCGYSMELPVIPLNANKIYFGAKKKKKTLPRPYLELYQAKPEHRALFLYTVTIFALSISIGRTEQTV